LPLPLWTCGSSELDRQFLFGLVALASAASWALGTVLWRKIGEEISPFSMNLGKGLIGSIYLAAAFLVVRPAPMSLHDFLYLGISGLLGITLGDTFFFLSLMHLGPSLSSLMGTLIPVSVAFSAVVFLGERPSLAAWVGIFLTVAGVAWVVSERRPRQGLVESKSWGVTLRLLSVLFMTAGIICAKIGVRSVPTVQATLVRMVWGVAGLLFWGFFNRQLRAWVAPLRDPRLLRKISLIVFIVVFGGFWLSLLSLKYLDASVAGALGSTAPLFILPIAAIMLGERITVKAGLATAMAVGGVALMLVRVS
jgi:drug/metabolite transporter (DMT)-like permease